jgi:hypothetical protein
LSASTSSCTSSTNENYYGRFDRTFTGAGLWRWLDPAELFRQGGGFTRVAALATNAAGEEPLPAPSSDPAPAAAASGGGGGGGCFIATAAYGSEWAPQVMVLREFRDRVLLRSGFGRRLVDFYYRHSPAWAGWLAGRPTAKALVRAVLLPVVEGARLTMKLMEGEWPGRSSASLLEEKPSALPARVQLTRGDAAMPAPCPKR